MISMIVLLHIAMAMIPNSTGDYNILVPGPTATLTTTSPFSSISVTSQEFNCFTIYTMYLLMTTTTAQGETVYIILRAIYIKVTIPLPDNSPQDRAEGALRLCEDEISRRDPTRRRKKRRPL